MLRNRRVPFRRFGCLSAFAGIVWSLVAHADTTAVTASDASALVLSDTTLEFVLSRDGDVSYPVRIGYHTVDGTAVSGIHFTGGSGGITLPAGASNGIIEIPVAAGTGGDRQFSLQLDTATGLGPAVSFYPAQNAITGHPTSVGQADVNGDGKLDVLAASFADDNVWIRINTTAPGATEPSFGSLSFFAVGDGPHQIVAADINGDGKPDLLTPNSSGNSVSVLLNTTAPGASTPSFTSASFATDAGPSTIAVADINRDGKPDLLTANYVGNSVSVLLSTTVPGAAIPSFSSVSNFAAGAGANAVVISDINGDGKLDVQVANTNANTTSVMLNTTPTGASNPSFSAQVSYLTGASPMAIASADANGDGRPDLMLANFNDNTVSVLLNTTSTGSASPSFAAQHIVSTGLAPNSIVAGDINGDGKSDLIVGAQGSNAISVLRNSTAAGAAVPSYAAYQSFPDANAPYALTLADINNDGKPDVLAANFGAVTVRLNTTAFSQAPVDFLVHPPIAVGERPFSVDFADINGDGRPDLLVINLNESTISALLNVTAPGANTPSFGVAKNFAVSQYSSAVRAVDVNGDARPDLLVPNSDAQTVSVLTNITSPGATSAAFSAPTAFAVGSAPGSATAADLNGDGKPDLIVANTTTTTVSVLLNTGTPGTVVPSFAVQQTFTVGSDPVAVAAKDLNGDGRLDLLVANSNDLTASVLLNTTTPGSAVFTFAPQKILVVESYPSSIDSADFNADGKSDAVIANAGGSTVSVLLNTTSPGAATASFSTKQSFMTGAVPRSALASDVNGDGKPDLLVASYGADSVSVFLNTTLPGSSSASFAAEKIIHVGSGPNSVAASDINGDGGLDLVVANAFGNTVSVLSNTQFRVNISATPAVGTLKYSVKPLPTAEAPTFSPNGGPYSGAQSVSISSATSGAAIYYTTDGSIPPINSTLYTMPITISSTATIKAIAVSEGYANSDVVSASFTIAPAAPASTPTFSPSSGSYAGSQNVSIGSATPGATIFYTRDGTIPTSNSTAYSTPITIASSQTIRAIATAAGYSASTVTNATYVITASVPTAAPVFSPGEGVYANSQSVTLSASAGAAIYYTTNGSAPTNSSTRYNGPITVSSSQIVKAIAIVGGFSPSTVATAAYTIAAPTATPSFSPAPGSYSGALTVAISSSTAGAVIYYTTDGSTPTTGSKLYAHPISLATSQTIKAIALASGRPASAVANASYTLTSAPNNGGGGSIDLLLLSALGGTIFLRSWMHRRLQSCA